MTMRLDIVTNDAGELVRREHARELGAGVVVAVYRLVKVAQMHDLGNQAFLRQLEQAHQIIGEYCLRSGGNVSVLFANKATFVAGQLLKGNRGAYEAAAELGELLERLGGSELQIARDVTREELNAFAEQISLHYRTGSPVRLPSKMQLRRVADSARLRGIELENLTPDQRLVRAYASAVVVMRRFFEDLAGSRYILPRRIKRVAQSLVDLSDASSASYLGVTEVRNANYDEAGRAVNTAIIAVAVARETTENRTALAQIAMAALMHDVARPRALALAGASGGSMPGMAGPTTLSEDQEDRLAAGAAAVLTALGRVNEPTVTRTVLTFEALWLRRRTWIGPVYWGARPPTIHASIIAIARRYNDLLTPEPGLAPPTTDFAVAMLANELTEAQDRTVLRMLVSALGLLPVGTLVQLSTGEVAEVVRGTKRLGDKPVVNVVADANGQPYPQPVEIDLAQDLRRRVHSVIGVDGWRKGLADAPQADGDGYDEDGGGASAPPPPAPPRAAPPAVGPFASMPSFTPAQSPSPKRSPSFSDQLELNRDAPVGGEPPGSSASAGSSPSAVAEAMGRMISDSLHPAPLAREGERPSAFPAAPPVLGERPDVESSPAPTARGTLASTPLPHVLVYMLDHRLTGTVLFETEGDGDAIYFVEGVPTKMRVVDGSGRLGGLLVENELLDTATVEQAAEAARRIGGMRLGEYLVANDLVSRAALTWALEQQLLRRIARAADLPASVEYAFYRDVDLVDTASGLIVVSHAISPVLAAVRDWSDRARIGATLNRIGKHPLAIHGESELTNLGLTAAEQLVMDVMRSEVVTLGELTARQLTDDTSVASLVYVLAVTRQFAFKGQKKGPMAIRQPTSPNASGVAAQPAAHAAAAFSSSANPFSSSINPFVAAQPAPSQPEKPASASSAASKPAAAPPRVRPVVGARPAPQIRPIGAKKSASNVAMAGAPAAAAVRESSPSLLKESSSGLKPFTSALRQSSPGLKPPSSGEVAATRSEDAPPPSTPGDGRTIAQPPSAMNAMIAARQMGGRAALPASQAAPQRPGSAATLEQEKVAPSRAMPVARAVGAVSPPPGTETVRHVARASDDDRMVTEISAAELEDADRANEELALQAMASFRLAEVALQRNDLATAEHHARRAFEADSAQSDYQVLFAWIRSQTVPSTIDDAIRTLTTILADNPDNERALLYRGKLFARANRNAEALHDIHEILASNPHHREALDVARQLKPKPGT